MLNLDDNLQISRLRNQSWLGASRSMGSTRSLRNKRSAVWSHGRMVTRHGSQLPTYAKTCLTSCGISKRHNDDSDVDTHNHDLRDVLSRTTYILNHFSYAHASLQLLSYGRFDRVAIHVLTSLQLISHFIHSLHPHLRPHFSLITATLLMMDEDEPRPFPKNRGFTTSSGFRFTTQEEDEWNRSHELLEWRRKDAEKTRNRLQKKLNELIAMGVVVDISTVEKRLRLVAAQEALSTRIWRFGEPAGRPLRTSKGQP